MEAQRQQPVVDQPSSARNFPSQYAEALKEARQEAQLLHQWNVNRFWGAVTLACVIFFCMTASCISK